NVDPLVGLAGVALAVFAGIAITAETIISKRMNDAGISALSIVSLRFSLVTALSAVMVARAPAAYVGLSVQTIGALSLVFLVILVGPIYLAQAGLKLTSPLISAVIAAIGPITTLALQSTTGAVKLSGAMLAVTVLYATVSIMAAVLGAARRASKLSPRIAAARGVMPRIASVSRHRVMRRVVNFFGGQPREKRALVRGRGLEGSRRRQFRLRSRKDVDLGEFRAQGGRDRSVLSCPGIRIAIREPAHGLVKRH